MKIQFQEISFFAFYKLIILKTLYFFFNFFPQQMHQSNHHDLKSTVFVSREVISTEKVLPLNYTHVKTL